MRSVVGGVAFLCWYLRAEGELPLVKAALLLIRRQDTEDCHGQRLHGIILYYVQYFNLPVFTSSSRPLQRYPRLTLALCYLACARILTSCFLVFIRTIPAGQPLINTTC
ncbi:unnamed protein product [Pleuronectes platessa]|uniref:Secreted protein n=1 Tax=Pleuronectes platessa TaxID=8262 RepID=A0A9N7VLQ6_PLEPL|nr:unnamed protein product [Pleuronectes platessa]